MKSQFDVVLLHAVNSIDNRNDCSIHLEGILPFGLLKL